MCLFCIGFQHQFNTECASSSGRREPPPPVRRTALERGRLPPTQRIASAMRAPNSSQLGSWIYPEPSSATKFNAECTCTSGSAGASPHPSGGRPMGGGGSRRPNVIAPAMFIPSNANHRSFLKMATGLVLTLDLRAPGSSKCNSTHLRNPTASGLGGPNDRFAIGGFCSRAAW